MTRKRRWLWVFLFVCLATVVASLAFGWNILIVRDYYRMVEFARTAVPVESHLPWLTLLIGTLGFVVTLGITILFFVKILKEMQLNQLQSDFLATVTHELKTPIAAIELAASLIRAGEVSEEETRRLWESHDEELQRLRLDVQALLDAARVQAGRRTRKGSVELETWLGRSMDRWRRILGPQAVLRREGEALPISAKVDPRALELITDNILDNARKYSKEHPDVTIVTERETRTGWFPGMRTKDCWRIRFVDRGWGFDPRDSKRIFGRFFRSRLDRVDAVPGTGLGLFIAHSTGRSSGLKLEGKSNGHGLGATFTLEGTIKRSFERSAR